MKRRKALDQQADLNVRPSVVAKPPHPPLYLLESLRDSIPSKVTRDILCIYKRGHAAHVKTPFTDPGLVMEFGPTLYGPLRQTAEAARDDVLAFKSALGTQSLLELRKQVAIFGAHGGSYSRVPHGVVPLLASQPIIACHKAPSHDSSPLTTIHGSRRPYVSVTIPLIIPPSLLPLLRRILDLTVDLLAAAVDTGMGIRPSWTDIYEAINRVIRPIPNSLVSTAETVYSAMASHPIFSALIIPSNSRDVSVISALILQLSRKANASDKTSVESLKKQRKAIQRLHDKRELVVYNVPRTASVVELSEALGGVKKVSFPDLSNPAEARTPRGIEPCSCPRGIAFVTCKTSAQAGEILEKTLVLQDRRLLIRKREGSESLKAALGMTTSKRQKLFSLPQELEDEIRKVARAKPGCNIGVIKQSIGKELNPVFYGFRNLVKALESVDGLRIEKIEGNRVPAFVAFLDGDPSA